MTDFNSLYAESLTEYRRRETIEVKVGSTAIGGDNPIRLQSMTTVDTMDTEGSIEQAIRMIEAGCELVRLTAPSLKEAKNLANIKQGLVERGYDTPLVADIHFTPNAAEVAARIVEKVRINPGNFVDKKKFDLIEYDDASYAQELERIRERFTPLVEICKEHGTAMRIGTNHGSLSDRILSRYGDTPLGMVESALEFLRICEDLDYYNVVLSMKASNTRVMVQAYRLLVAKLKEEGLKPYPLHLGVTEAGDGEDGRVKSAVGIGALLEDGLGDTIRVSLTEEPEFEIPVAASLAGRYDDRQGHEEINSLDSLSKSPYDYERRESTAVLDFGGEESPRVIADFSKKEGLSVEDLKSVGHFYLPATDKWAGNDLACDYIYTGSQELGIELPSSLGRIADASVWETTQVKTYPLFDASGFTSATEVHSELNFVRLSEEEAFDSELQEKLKEAASVVLVLSTENKHAMAALRRVCLELMEKGLKHPVVFERAYGALDDESLQIHASTDLGGLLVDGFGDGVMLSPANDSKQEFERINGLAFGILQAARTRMSKAEYISCPSCGRTLFDLQETTAMIRKRTDHLKGIKIGIMGCIVNGPGEMADADYGYVGSGVGKITLYRGQEVVKRGVPSENAVDELIEIIREDGKWLEAQEEEELDLKQGV